MFFKSEGSKEMLKGPDIYFGNDIMETILSEFFIDKEKVDKKIGKVIIFSKNELLSLKRNLSILFGKLNLGNKGDLLFIKDCTFFNEIGTEFNKLSKKSNPEEQIKRVRLEVLNIKDNDGFDKPMIILIDKTITKEGYNKYNIYVEDKLRFIISKYVLYSNPENIIVKCEYYSNEVSNLLFYISDKENPYIYSIVIKLANYQFNVRIFDAINSKMMDESYLLNNEEEIIEKIKILINLSNLQELEDWIKSLTINDSFYDRVTISVEKKNSNKQFTSLGWIEMNNQGQVTYQQDMETLDNLISFPKKIINKDEEEKVLVLSGSN